MQRSAEFLRGAKWFRDTYAICSCKCGDDGAAVLVDLLAEAEASEGSATKAFQNRIKQLEAMNAGLLRHLSNIHIACKPANLTAPDGKEWTFHPPDELVRRYWETLSKAVQEALASEAREAAEPDLGTAAPKRTGTLQVTLRAGGAGVPLSSAGDVPSAAEVIAAAERALLQVGKWDAFTQREKGLMKDALALIGDWKEAHNA